MAQFDVHRNLGPARQEIPFVVIVQTRRLDQYRHRVVVPLVLASSLPRGESELNPGFRIDSLDVVLHPLQIAAVAVDRLGERVSSLAPEGDRIIRAIDAVITRAWG